MSFYPNLNKWLLPVLATVVTLFLTACSGNYGKLQYNQEVSHAFSQYEMIEGYRYFYYGRQSLPMAIVGIDPAFEFSSKFWRAIDPNDFQTMVKRLFPPMYGLLNGAYLITPDGRKAGVWYSWVQSASVKFEDDRVILAFRDPSVGYGKR